MKLTICVTSDLHGRLDQFEQIATAIKQQRPDILLDNGDFLQGSLTSYYYDFINPQPHPMLAMANELGYDAATFGNHEFNYSLPGINAMRDACDFPWLACNMGNFAKPYIIKKVNGKKIAIIGAVTHHTPHWDEQKLTDDFIFEDAAIALQFWIRHVKKFEQPDLVIVSYHGGFTKDPVTGAYFDEENGENQGNELLTHPDIDILITGHQHLEIAAIIQGKAVLQPGANGQCFGTITYDFETAQFEQVVLQRVLLVEYYPQQVDDWLHTEIGYIEEDCRYSDLLTSRLRNHPVAELIHAVQFHHTQADLSIVDLGYEGHGGFYGTITNKDILSTISRPNLLHLIELTGAELLQFLEQIAATFAVNEKGAISFSYNVHFDEPQPYLYYFIGGLDYKMDIQKPLGQRVVHCQKNGMPIAANQRFRVALNSYLTTGVDFPFMKRPLCAAPLEQTLPELVRAYVQQHRPLKISTHGHFQIVAEEN